MNLSPTYLSLVLAALMAAPAAHAARLELPPLDLAKLAAEDLALAGKPGVPLRYGRVHDFAAKGQSAELPALDSAGRWSTSKTGEGLWQLEIEGGQARNLSLHFGDFRLPAGAELAIYAADDKQPALRYSDAANPVDAGLRTPLIEGSKLRLVLRVPAGLREVTRLRLDSVVQGYRDPFSALAQAKSGSCNIDVACPEGNDWRPQIRSVAHYTFNSGSGSFVCTGQLVATGQNAADVAEPRFLTAHHCLSTQAEVGSMTFYWRYESPSCRAPGSSASGQRLAYSGNTAATQSGATLLATHEPTDFTIVRLNAPVPAAAEPFYSGWDRSGSVPTGAVGIHHPSGHEKRISIDDDALSVGASCILQGATAQTHWYVDNWDAGTTEQGSSGSGLWRRDSGRLIGVLSGGLASCSAPDQYDCYGALDKGWEGGGAAASRMRDWMDRAGSNPQSLDGHQGCSAPSVSLDSAAFASPPGAGTDVSFTASASGGSGAGYRYEWDLDGDGSFERSTGSTAAVSVRYPRRLSTQVRVRVIDGANCPGTASRALDVRAPQIAAAPAAPPQQLCGNGNSSMDPGERWRLPVALSNQGELALPAGAHALFANGDAGPALPGLIGPNDFGYVATTSEEASGLCGYGFVDIGSTPALNLTDEDDGRSAVIPLGGAGFRLYGQTYTQAVMGTNGYVSFDPADTGGDYDNSCSGELNRGGRGPRLHVLHDDLVVSSSGALRYRYYDNCPRASSAGGGQACHVFQWDGLQSYSSQGPSGDASFQAIAYPATGSIVYQYRRADRDNGASATIGLVDAAGADPFNASCNDNGAVQVQSAICLFDPQNLPVAAQAQLTVETPTQPVPALAPGTSATVAVDVAIPQNAECGAPLALDYLATAARGQHSMQPAGVLRMSLGSSCSVVNSCAAPAPRALPRRGFFSDSARGGNGLASFLYGDAGNPVLGAIWYTGDRDYRSDWYTFAGPWRSGLLETQVFRSRNLNPQGFQPVSTPIGRVWLGSVDARTQVFAWDFGNGQRGAELLTSTAGAAPYASPDHTNAWVQTGQTGWGLAAEGVQLGDGPLEFFGVYLYDAEGRSRWVTGTSRSTGNGSLELQSQRTHCPGCPFYPDYLGLSQAAGSLERIYSSRTRARINLNVQLPAPLSGSWSRSDTAIEAFGDSNP